MKLRGFLFLLCVTASSLTLADDQYFGSWGAGELTDGAGAFAGTVNDSGALFGQFCYKRDGNCAWLLAISTSCEDGTRYPVLINGGTGSDTAQVICTGTTGDGKSRYVFSDFDTIGRAIVGAKTIGFAFPMRDGMFQVSRFTLDGSPEALAYLRGIASNFGSAPPPTRPTGTRDQRL